MPDPLYSELRSSRQRLLDAIDQPELSAIAVRAAGIRRRSRIVRAAVAGTACAALLVAAGLGLVRPWGTGHRSAPPAAGEPTPPGGPVWHDRGITINGLVGTATDVAGTVYAAEFPDPDHGYVLAAQCAGGDCTVTFAASADGGQTWALDRTPQPVRRARADRLPVLRVLGRQVVVAADPTARELRRWVSDDGGVGWRELSFAGAGVAPADAIPRDGSLDVDGTGCGLTVWEPSAGPTPSPLREQPPLVACFPAAAPAASGAWWVGGVTRDADQRAAVAVTRDAGRSWTTVELDEAAGGVSRTLVATLGSEVYAVVVGAGGTIRSIHRSTDRGATFTAMRPAGPRTIAGDPVPLLDGRLLLADTDGRWWVSEPGTAAFAEVKLVHTVARLARTGSGYVAYDLLRNGWTAYSSDGSNWRKLNVR